MAARARGQAFVSNKPEARRSHAGDSLETNSRRCSWPPLLWRDSEPSDAGALWGVRSVWAWACPTYAVYT